MIIQDADGLSWEIKASQYDNPDNETGQHTNGPASIFVRGNGKPWLYTGQHSMHKVVHQVQNYGMDYVEFIEAFEPSNERAFAASIAQ